MKGFLCYTTNDYVRRKFIPKENTEHHSAQSNEKPHGDLSVYKSHVNNERDIKTTRGLLTAVPF